jgi:transglutaminase-like putative cysteine protease
MAANFSAKNKLGDDHPLARRASPAASIHYEPLAEGQSGTLQSLAAMRAAVLGQIPPDYSGYRDPYNQQAAISIVRGSANEIAALLRFVRDQIFYVNHPWNMQVVKDCKRTLESRQGDCVSKSVCLATLLAACGITPQFIAQAPDGENFSHVYVEADVNGRYVPLDPTADGRDGRPYGDIGWFQVLPREGLERVYQIF